MKQEVSQTVVYAMIAVAVAILLFVGYRFMGPSKADRAAVDVLQVSERLGKAHGDATKLSQEDQDFIKKHPNTFKTVGSARFNGPMGTPTAPQTK